MIRYVGKSATGGGVYRIVKALIDDAIAELQKLRAAGKDEMAAAHKWEQQIRDSDMGKKDKERALDRIGSFVRANA